MIFLYVLALIIGAQSLFSFAFFTQHQVVFTVIGIVQLATFSTAFALLLRYFRKRPKNNYKKGFYAFGAMIASGVPGLGFLIPGLIWLFTGNEIVLYIGWSLAGMLFVAILFGIFVGRWNWKVHRVELSFPHLPESMHGTKWLQISDVHVGSFFNQYHKVEKAIQKMNSLDADYVVFTGDLVNNAAEELDGWEPTFSRIKAKKGKFSILGNHDYGDYVKWENDHEKVSNLTKLIEKHKAIGFTPLLNHAVEIAPQFWLLGVENWGTAPFRQSGKLFETLANVPENAFKLLLSHDPSHFDEQVLQTNVDLTLSGHTHGMQFGIERFGIKWSPVSLRYKKWAGLYTVGKQHLYVNRGFGYLGFPGRVGIYPEITEIILKKA